MPDRGRICIIMEKDQEQKMFARTRHMLKRSYAEDYGVGITPTDIGHFMSMFSNWSRPKDLAPLDYEGIYESLTYFDVFSEEHNKAISMLGRWAATASRYGEVDDETFGWGYNLYLNVVPENTMKFWCERSSEHIMHDPSCAGRSVDEALQDLAAEAETSNRLLFDVADDLLDRIVEQHGIACDDGEDDSEFEQAAIRGERLLVMHAGIGLAYRHLLETVDL